MKARIVWALILLPVALTVSALGGGPPAGKDIKQQVKELLSKLENGPTHADRISAEWGLLKLGPDILPLLPPVDKVAPAAKAELAAVRTTLEELLPRTWTPKKEKMSLGEAMAALVVETKLALVYRVHADVKNGVTLPTKSATYWESLESMAIQNNLRVSLYERDGQMAIVDGPNPKLPVSLHGAFRVAVKSTAVKRQFDGQTHSGVLGLEIAWEPRFSPYLIEAGPLTFRAGDSPEGPMTAVPAGGPILVTEKIAKEFDITFPAPPRSAAALRNVKGHFVVTMPCKSLEFTFKKPTGGDQQSQDGVALTLSKTTLDKERWAVDLLVQVPAAGPAFQSFQSWLGSAAWLDQNTCRLERGAGDNKEVLRPDPLYTRIVGVPSATRVVVRYQFTPPATASDFASWRLVAVVPARMVEMTVPFEFGRVELP